MVMEATTLAAYDKAVPATPVIRRRRSSMRALARPSTRHYSARLGGEDATFYFHVPFCAQLCWYCACNTIAMNRAELLDAYAGAMMLEIDRLAELAPELIVGAIQWVAARRPSSGRGACRRRATPRGALRPTQRRRVSMEIDPRYCEDEFVDARREIGVTRASLGVQDFDSGVQQAINRRQSAGNYRRRARSVAPRAGIRRINIDLVYGLPRQTFATLSRDARLMRPWRWSPIDLPCSAMLTSRMKPRQRLIDQAELPGAALRAEMAALVSERVNSAGYRQIGLDHCARLDDSPGQGGSCGRLRRTFQGRRRRSRPGSSVSALQPSPACPMATSRTLGNSHRYGAVLVRRLWPRRVGGVQ